MGLAAAAGDRGDHEANIHVSIILGIIYTYIRIHDNYIKEPIAIARIMLE